MTRTALTLSLAAFAAVAFASAAEAGKRSEADLALWRQARAECQSWKHMPDGAAIHINYKEGWFRCDDRKDRRRDKRRAKGK